MDTKECGSRIRSTRRLAGFLLVLGMVLGARAEPPSYRLPGCEQQAGCYLAALNGVVEPGKKLAGGTGFDGSLFLEFEDGGALWQLSWHTLEPGVTLYRWKYRREKPHASWKERAAQGRSRAAR